MEIEFLEWVAENHYRLVNISNGGLRYWENEDETKTSFELFQDFIMEKVREKFNN